MSSVIVGDCDQEIFTDTLMISAAVLWYCKLQTEAQLTLVPATVTNSAAAASKINILQSFSYYCDALCSVSSPD